MLMKYNNLISIDGSSLNERYDQLSSKASAILDKTPTPYKPLVEYALHVSQRQRVNAGFSGAHDDGGAGSVEDTIEAWVSGLNEQVPKSMADIQKAYAHATDPDYALYIKLKEKFE